MENTSERRKSERMVNNFPSSAKKNRNRKGEWKSVTRFWTKTTISRMKNKNTLV